jgi:hypothetical protein
MVPGLRGVIENCRVRHIVRGRDDRFEWLTFIAGAGDRRIQLVDVCLVMLAVVKLERLRSYVGLECIDCIGECREFYGHHSLLEFVGSED